jgi:predicted PolB exonuclease-like 3'-5' exonuclease
MLQKQKDQESEQNNSELDNIRDKFSKQKDQIIDIEVSKEDRQVKLIVNMDQFCGCGGKDNVNVIRTVPWNSPLQDGDTVEGLDDSDEIGNYI